jgi:hypothetical protein
LYLSFRLQEWLVLLFDLFRHQLVLLEQQDLLVLRLLMMPYQQIYQLDLPQLIAFRLLHQDRQQS